MAEEPDIQELRTMLHQLKDSAFVGPIDFSPIESPAHLDRMRLSIEEANDSLLAAGHGASLWDRYLDIRHTFDSEMIPDNLTAEDFGPERRNSAGSQLDSDIKFNTTSTFNNPDVSTYTHEVSHLVNENNRDLRRIFGGYVTDALRSKNDAWDSYYYNPEEIQARIASTVYDREAGIIDSATASNDLAKHGLVARRSKEMLEDEDVKDAYLDLHLNHMKTIFSSLFGEK